MQLRIMLHLLFVFFMMIGSNALSQTHDNPVPPADESQFWSIVDSSMNSGSAPALQLKALRQSLSALPADQIERFQATFEFEMNRANSWDLWGADYVIHGGASDDGFEYFRSWVISRGRKVFEKALANPDSLADEVPKGTTEALEFESFAYIAKDVWTKKMGKPITAFPPPATSLPGGSQPRGKPFKEDSADLAAHYPKLWKRFSKSPLQ